jgi:hypothetical protein
VNGWEEAIARLRERTGIAPALAAAGVLLAARADWSERVAAQTAGHDLLFTRPGAPYPFDLDVRLSLVGRVYELRLVTPAGVLARSTATAADVDALLAGYLQRLCAAADS